MCLMTHYIVDHMYRLHKLRYLTPTLLSAGLRITDVYSTQFLETMIAEQNSPISIANKTKRVKSQARPLFCVHHFIQFELGSLCILQCHPNNMYKLLIIIGKQFQKHSIINCNIQNKRIKTRLKMIKKISAVN